MTTHRPQSYKVGSDQSRARKEALTRASVVARRSFTVAALTARAFTIIELMVSMAVLAVTIIAVATIFNISSDAASRTESHAEVLEASAAFQQSISDDLAHLTGGLLIIESPPPTLVRTEVSGGEKIIRLRHDRLVFLASRGSDGEFQSFTDPTYGDPANPTRKPAGSPEAMIYYGPGIPVEGNGSGAGLQKLFDDEAVALAASDWVFSRRAILLMGAAPAVAGWTPPDMADFDAGLITSAPDIFDARMDALVSTATEDATAAKVAQQLLGIPVGAPTARLSDLWRPNLTPITLSLSDSTYADYYARSGFTFQPRLTDFRIEWTDGGSIDLLGPDGNPNTGDENYGTRWFGLAPYRDEVPDLTSINSVKYQARMRSNPGAGNPSNPNPLNADNNNLARWSEIEWSTPGAADAQARYRAVWRSDVWQAPYKPTALKFTYRIYDATRRLKQNATLDFNEDGLPDPDPNNAGKPYVTTRFGQEFSIVVPLP